MPAGADCQLPNVPLVAHELRPTLLLREFIAMQLKESTVVHELGEAGSYRVTRVSKRNWPD